MSDLTCAVLENCEGGKVLVSGGVSKLDKPQRKSELCSQRRHRACVVVGLQRVNERVDKAAKNTGRAWVSGLRR